MDMGSDSRRALHFTSPRSRGEVGAQRRVRGCLRVLNLTIDLAMRGPSPQPSPRNSGEREN
jgi:hypothetical protein